MEMEYFEECENCCKDISESFKRKSWYLDELCEECNKDRPKQCMVCDKEIEEEETYCSRYCFEEFTADY